MASSCATVVAAAGSEVISQPSILAVVKLPVITGGVLSSMLIVCAIVEVLLQASVTV